jgi:nitroreductase
LMENAGATMSDADIDKTYLDSTLAQALATNPSAIMARTFENMGIAYGFLILEAMNQGLGACIVGEVGNELVAVNNEKYREVKAYFGLGETDIITAAIVLGYPAKEGPISPRKPENEVIFFHD